MKWVHKMCSGVKGSLQTASAVFICKKCQGEIPPSVMAEEGLAVGGEKYDIVDIFCYLCYMSSMEGGADTVCNNESKECTVHGRNLGSWHPS